MAAFPYRLTGGGLRPDAISGLDPRMQRSLLALYASAPPEVQRELGITSGYRSPEVQRKLWEASDRSGKMVAAPGKSKHNFGMAVDLSGFGLGGQNSVSSATRDWVTQNAGAQNLYFPMSYEPWHLQYKAEEMKAAGYSDDQIKTALLGTIAGTESPGYNVRYGGGTFSDFSQHPNIRTPVKDRPGEYSTAAGRYQFINDTWTRLAKQHGLKDFSPGNQDIAAWQLAAETMGGEDKLYEALRSGDPGRINAVGSMLGKQWEGVKKLGTGTFAELYNKALGAAPAGTPEPADDGGADAPTLPEKDKPSWLELIAKNMKGVSMGGPGVQMSRAVHPGASIVDAPQPQAPVMQVGGINPAQREQLAMIMQRLNSGKLVV